MLPRLALQEAAGGSPNAVLSPPRRPQGHGGSLGLSREVSDEQRPRLTRARSRHAEEEGARRREEVMIVYLRVSPWSIPCRARRVYVG